MDIADVVIERESLMNDYCCIVNKITITPLTKKQYLVDVPGADGSRDLAVWFGSPRFESRTLKIYVQSTIENARICADRLANKWTGKTVDIRLSFDEDFFRRGMVMQVSPTGTELSDEVVISILCDPCRYRNFERTYDIPASEIEVSYVWRNDGVLDVVPTLLVQDENVTLKFGVSNVTLSSGTHILPELAIPGESKITVTAAGGAFRAKYREAIR